MNVFKLTVMIIDHDNLGADGIKSVLENTRFANDCLDPKVMGSESVDIGEWQDDHLLNYRDSEATEFARLFPGEAELKAELARTRVLNNALRAQKEALATQLGLLAAKARLAMESAEDFDVLHEALEEVGDADGHLSHDQRGLYDQAARVSKEIFGRARVEGDLRPRPCFGDLFSETYPDLVGLIDEKAEKLAASADDDGSKS